MNKYEPYGRVAKARKKTSGKGKKNLNKQHVKNPQSKAEQDKGIEKGKKIDKNKNGHCKEQFEKALSYHELGIKGDKEAVKNGYELLKKLHSQNPDDSIIEAYFGSITTLMGRDDINPINRFKLSMKGLKSLDHAVLQEADNIEIRFLRGKVCYRLPEMYFHRTDTAVEDFGYLISRYEKDSDVFSEERYWQLLFDLGTAYKNIDRTREAQAAWEKLLSVTDDPKYKKLVKQQGVKAGPSGQNESKSLKKPKKTGKKTGTGQREHTAGNAVDLQEKDEEKETEKKCHKGNAEEAIFKAHKKKG